MEWNRLEFGHEHFQDGKLHRLKTIKNKKRQSNVNKSGVSIIELKATFAKVTQDHKQFSNRIGRFKYGIEQTLAEIQTIIEAMINNLVFTFSETIGQKRAFLDIASRIHFIDIMKDVQSVNDHFEGLGSDDDCLKSLTDLAEKVIIGCNGNDDRHGVDNGCSIPKFLHELYDMVANEDIDDLISWSLPNCDTIIIWDINKFATHVLPKYFKHKNFSSFNSQLNIYVSV